jgi:ribonuclease P protein component
LREIVRLHQNELRTGRWIVIIARAAASAAKYDALEAEWLRLARAAQLLDETP